MDVPQYIACHWYILWSTRGMVYHYTTSSTDGWCISLHIIPATRGGMYPSKEGRTPAGVGVAIAIYTLYAIGVTSTYV